MCTADVQSLGVYKACWKAFKVSYYIVFSFLVGSDASSEKSSGSQSTGNESLSSKNTYLARDTSGQHFAKALNRFSDNMRIDNSLFNPDSLWHRPNAGWVYELPISFAALSLAFSAVFCMCLVLLGGTPVSLKCYGIKFGWKLIYWRTFLRDKIDFNETNVHRKLNSLTLTFFD